MQSFRTRHSKVPSHARSVFLALLFEARARPVIEGLGFETAVAGRLLEARRILESFRSFGHELRALGLARNINDVLIDVSLSIENGT